MRAPAAGPTHMKSAATWQQIGRNLFCSSKLTCFVISKLRNLAGTWHIYGRVKLFFAALQHRI